MTARKRDPSMDVIRCFALFCVIGVHFFLNSEFYNVPIQEGWTLLAVLLRSGFMICVPLFIVLSGYLMRSRTPCLKYYSKIFKTIGIYLLASACCEVFKWVYLKYPISSAETIRGVLDYTAAPYAWYVEMYLGLFLIIPYLNILYNNIPTQKQKQLLLLILAAVTALPCVVNIRPVPDGYYQILPEWWKDLYPVTYYFIGCYLSEYSLKISKRVNALLILLVYAAAGGFNYCASYGDSFSWGPWQDWGSLFHIALTLLVFHFLARLDYSRVGPGMAKVLGKLSDWCFGAYLVSWIFDQYFYEYLNELQPDAQLQLIWFPLIVPAVYVCSLGLSAVLSQMYRLFESSVMFLFGKIKTTAVK